MKNTIPDWFYDYARVALLGEIYPSIRGIAFIFDENKKYLKLRYDLDAFPSDFDEESISIVATNFESQFPIGYFNEIETECLYVGESTKDIDTLDGFLYFRKECPQHVVLSCENCKKYY